MGVSCFGMSREGGTAQFFAQTTLARLRKTVCLVNSVRSCRGASL